MSMSFTALVAMLLASTCSCTKESEAPKQPAPEPIQPKAERFEVLLRESIAYAFAHPEVSRDFIKSHAQEMEDSVIDRHIALFVNEFSLTLGDEGREAVRRLIG